MEGHPQRVKGIKSVAGERIPKQIQSDFIRIGLLQCDLTCGDHLKWPGPSSGSQSLSTQQFPGSSGTGWHGIKD